jgi:hypothetical protein
MRQQFLMHIDTDTIRPIPCEEIMILSSIKTNLFRESFSNITIIEIILSDHLHDPGKTMAVVKIQSLDGEYAGYSCSETWETAMCKAFESILQQKRLNTNLQVPENTN